MPFTINKYPELIQQTAVFPTKVDDFSLAYFTLGLYDEISEYTGAIRELIHAEMSEDLSYIQKCKEDAIKEAGDVCWYICGICNYLDIDFIDLISNIDTNKLNKYSHTYKLLGLVKKYYRDNKQLDLSVVKTIFEVILQPIVSTLDIETVLEVNYNKLINRKNNNTLHGDGDNR